MAVKVFWWRKSDKERALELIEQQRLTEQQKLKTVRSRLEQMLDEMKKNDEQPVN